MIYVEGNYYDLPHSPILPPYKENTNDAQFNYVLQWLLSLKITTQLVKTEEKK